MVALLGRTTQQQCVVAKETSKPELKQCLIKIALLKKVSQSSINFYYLGAMTRTLTMAMAMAVTFNMAQSS